MWLEVNEKFENSTMLSQSDLKIMIAIISLASMTLVEFPITGKS